MKRDELRGKIINLENDVEEWKIKCRKISKEYDVLEGKLKVEKDMTDLKVGPVSIEKADQRNRIRSKRHATIEK